MATDAILVLCTLPDSDRAIELVRTIVDERLVACVNLLPNVRSIYRWEGAVQDDAERLAIIKTTRAGWEAARARIAELHPYSCPEIIAVDIAEGHAPYLTWLAEMVG